MDGVDAMLLGRKTFETVLGFGGPWPYGALRVVVLSARGIDIPAEVANRVDVWAGEPTEIARRLSVDGHRKVYVDGGATIQRFLRAGLIDELVVTRVPVLIGSGIPLFGNLDHDLPLEHVRTTSHSGGLVQSRYRLPSQSAS